MFTKVIVIMALISAAICRPQLITFKDGNIGVNFAGFTAQAGLGGLLTGNAAHGGLSASAGTPFGQRAAAGIGGSLDGRTLGGAYAGATAGNGIGASAGLGGIVGGGGALAAESHVGGISKSVVKVISPNEQPPSATGQIDYYAQEKNYNGQHEPQANVVQKIKPPKKYAPEPAENHVSLPNFDTRSEVDKSFVVNENTKTIATGNPSTGYNNNYNNEQQQPQVFVYRKHIRPFRRRFHTRKQFVPIYYQPTNTQEVHGVESHLDKVSSPAPVQVFKRKDVFINASPVGHSSSSVQGSVGGLGNGFFDSIFNIPIATLRAVNGFLNQGFGGGVAVRKTVDIQHH